MYVRGQSNDRHIPDNPTRRASESPKDVRDANENIRKAQDEDATGPKRQERTGNRPAFDRDR
jgi:hypothetical protein